MGNRNGQDAGPSISNDREAHRLVSHIPLTRRTLLCTILAVDSRKGSLIPTLARTASRRRPSLKEDIVPFSECRSNLAACFAQAASSACKVSAWSEWYERKGWDNNGRDGKAHSRNRFNARCVLLLAAVPILATRSSSALFPITGEERGRTLLPCFV